MQLYFFQPAGSRLRDLAARCRFKKGILPIPTEIEQPSMCVISPKDLPARRCGSFVFWDKGMKEKKKKKGKKTQGNREGKEKGSTTECLVCASDPPRLAFVTPIVHQPRYSSGEASITGIPKTRRSKGKRKPPKTHRRYVTGRFQLSLSQTQRPHPVRTPGSTCDSRASLGSFSSDGSRPGRCFRPSRNGSRPRARSAPPAGTRPGCTSG